jgi:phosphatidylserine decarboxylase
VNRTPIAGTVDYFTYRTGKFWAAFKEEASRENEQTAIGIANQNGHRVLFKQIAGIIARRIICHLREGQKWEAGKRMGLIRYGSRVDVFVPVDAKILVKTGQTVRGGESILATFPNGGDFSSVEQTIVEVPKTEVSP